MLTQRVNKLEESLSNKEVKLTPNKPTNLNNNLEKILKDADMAMDRFINRHNDEG